MGKQGLIRFQPNGMGDEGIPTTKVERPSLKEGTPVEGVSEFYRSGSGELTAGVWTCTPCTEEVPDYPVDEFMQILEGRIVITCPGEAPQTFKAGDSLFVAKGTSFTWKVEETARKYYVIYESKSQARA